MLLVQESMVLMHIVRRDFVGWIWFPTKSPSFCLFLFGLIRFNKKVILWTVGIHPVESVLSYDVKLPDKLLHAMRTHMLWAMMVVGYPSLTDDGK